MIKSDFEVSGRETGIWLQDMRQWVVIGTQLRGTAPSYITFLVRSGDHALEPSTIISSQPILPVAQLSAAQRWLKGSDRSICEKI